MNTAITELILGEAYARSPQPWACGALYVRPDGTKFYHVRCGVGSETTVYLMLDNQNDEKAGDLVTREFYERIPVPA